MNLSSNVHFPLNIVIWVPYLPLWSELGSHLRGIGRIKNSLLSSSVHLDYGNHIYRKMQGSVHKISDLPLPLYSDLIPKVHLKFCVLLTPVRGPGSLQSVLLDAPIGKCHEQSPGFIIKQFPGLLLGGFHSIAMNRVQTFIWYFVCYNPCKGGAILLSLLHDSQFKCIFWLIIEYSNLSPNVHLKFYVPLTPVRGKLCSDQYKYYQPIASRIKGFPGSLPWRLTW